MKDYLKTFISNDEIIDPDGDEGQFEGFSDWLIEPCAVQIRHLSKIHGGGIGGGYHASAVCLSESTLSSTCTGPA